MLRGFGFKVVRHQGGKNEYSGTSSMVVFSMHILDFNQRQDE